MERIPRGIYSQEFRGEAVRLHVMDGLTVPEVAERLSLPQGTLKNWVYADRIGQLRLFSSQLKAGFILYPG